MKYPDYSRHVHYLRAHFGASNVRTDSSRTIVSTERGVTVVEDVQLLSDTPDPDRKVPREWIQVAAIYGDDDRLFRVIVVKNDSPVEVIFDYDQAGTIRS